MHGKRKNKLKRILWLGLSTIVLLAAASLYGFYYLVLKPNLTLSGSAHFYIPTGSSFEDVLTSMTSTNLLKNKATFKWMAERKNYHNRVIPGRYLLKENMGNNALVNLLRSGRQDPVRLTFNNIRDKQQLASIVSASLEADSASIMELFRDEGYLLGFGMVPETAILLFIPNTYEVYWNTPASQLFERMHREYKRFWNESRIELAVNAGLTPVETMILASIVQRETTRTDEMPRIAGVYINRLRRNMLLQADPTVVYAVGDYSIRRVLYSHLAIDSPYNTYKYPGLPPGPIGLPEPYVTDHVLNFERHDYLFFCARDDFSGYHAFARTHSEHLVNARRFHRALNQRNIMR